MAVLLLARATAWAQLPDPTPDPAPTSLRWHFTFDENGVPNKLVWETQSGKKYDLWYGSDLGQLAHQAGYPKDGTGNPMEHPLAAGLKGFFKVDVTDSSATATEGFLLVPAGEFQMGDQSSPLVGESNELPVHTVYVSAFSISKHEVTKALWDEVRAWGATRGYADLPQGSTLGTSNYSKGDDHPVTYVKWYAMLKWCNARSEKDELTPCYSTAAGAVYRTGKDEAVTCNWNANGYRLPTEAEWEKAARGRQVGKNFPWDDTISHEQANYFVLSTNNRTNYYSYDVSKTLGYHPDHAKEGTPYTSPVGKFPSNGYGLHDVAGNVWEWCWDWYGNYAAGLQTDPRGPASGTYRVVRGGSWNKGAKACRVAYRSAEFGPDDFPDVLGNVGFRLVRGSGP